MGISDVIASFIQSALEETDGVLELQRSDLAQRFNCVPSQINYVMSTCFSPEHGYIVESRRGGNGYIRITRVRTDRKTLLMHVINSIGDELDAASARAIVQNICCLFTFKPAFTSLSAALNCWSFSTTRLTPALGIAICKPPFLWQFNTIHGAVFCKLLKQLVETQKSRLSPRIPKQPDCYILQSGKVDYSVAVKVPLGDIVNPDSLSIVLIACSA